MGSLLSFYLECYNQFKVHLPCTAATFKLLLKIDSRSLIKTFICSQMVHALSFLDFIFRDLYEKLEGLEGEFLHSLEGKHYTPNPSTFSIPCSFSHHLRFSPTSIVFLSFLTTVYSSKSAFPFVGFYFSFIFTNCLPCIRQTLMTF